MAKKLEITKIEVNSELTLVDWHRFDTEDLNQNDTGRWEFDGVLNPDQVLEKAKTMVDSDIEVSFNLEVKPEEPKEESKDEQKNENPQEN